MKGVYWKSNRRSGIYFLILASFSLTGLYLVETCRKTESQAILDKKLEASSLAKLAFEEIRKEKGFNNRIPDPKFDPSGSGLIGTFFSPVTSNLGVLAAKQTSVNPNFSALVLEYLQEAGVKEGDTIALGFSGSFPALNICVYAAAKTLGLKLVTVSSISSSQWGANEPDFLWPDMESILYKKNIFPYRSSAFSIGGIEDKGVGIGPEGLSLLSKAAERNGISLMHSDSFSESLEERMSLYSREANGIDNYKAYINVGGGSISVGTKFGSKEFRPGLNRINSVSPSADSVLSRFYEKKVPVIHLTRIQELAVENGLPLRPKKLPEVGEGGPFHRLQYDLRLALAVLVLLLLLLYVFFRTDSFLVISDADISL
ncbi:poly-gamma-glutamate system protein [Leptospira wolffii]|uniref:Poly-gamma-glutamate system protein n=1 Tax=Leptospira wolffii TaxID=409998 RepID=A0A2M9Z6S3_9LEPT|nr:poly-gamma-glutamate system protein [Leptospira wolffii]PJZ64084.1 poly-gamma-glutamate system protein [Leptospira wolffii]